jgi:hypothetical protein
MSVMRTVRRSVVVGVTAGALGLVAVGGPAPASAVPDRLDPATLARGTDPGVAHLVGDTIVDGDRRVAATTLGEHGDLWTTSRGYVVDDVVQGRETFRLVYVSRSGEKRVIARRSWPTGTAVSPGQRRIAWGKALGRLGPPTVVKVANPDTGRVLASRRFHFATVFAVSDRRVLLTLRAKGGPETTWWWDYRNDTLSQVSIEPARRADLRHDRVVLATGAEDSFCNRVARLSSPERTLWASCAVAPHAWSPSGRRATATHTYFDETGTDRWLTVRDRTGDRVGRVTGRLDWDTAWEDDRHFLTMAQNGHGQAAVVRCTVGGTCERASRLWDVGWDGYPPYYLAPPVVLSGN